MKKRYKFFIVDDDRVTLNLMTRYLEKEGQTVAGITSSSNALREIIAQRPDCVIVDLMMPDVDGLEMIRHIRGESRLNDIDVERLQGAGDDNFRVSRHRKAWRLFAVAQSRVKNLYVVRS